MRKLTYNTAYESNSKKKGNFFFVTKELNEFKKAKHRIGWYNKTRKKSIVGSDISQNTKNI
eukprot:CAMPEP_0197293734 /NCGR_PEP_ID=MMETSP0890-20130614/29724_1 /TAXON_ID=44058 ORGANISM="Aureoumbra lagunensis, Strain CCMP1510" /NCGR_SAMPLE_ID=MMETSP0890 /ASSEMBLY_ACC=CAM_ASM_000533 /LENGTH=60 /DNA_ID=CAMNT_0042768717 /DNA_START=364 /DNA_END=546 /DNA_ORIENTATION=+